jgi:hypothetical protein
VKEVARRLLIALGHRVYTAESESQARWIWQRHQAEISLLIADLMIPPGATGTALAARLRQEKPSLRVLFTSGFGREISESDTSTPIEAPFLPKPFSLDSLRAALTYVLNRRPDPADAL